MSRRRGQAAVELAIGSAVLVSLIILGIHMAELSLFSLKVQEAAAFAMFQSTGKRTHSYAESRLPSGAAIYEPFTNSMRNIEGHVEDRYRDLDGMSGRSVSRRLLFTQVRGVDVQCSPVAGGFDLPRAGGYRNAVKRDTMQLMRRYYQDRALACTVAADVSAFAIRRDFATEREGGYNREELASGAVMRFCGAGRALGSECKSTYAMLSGDWGMEGPAPANWGPRGMSTLNGDSTLHDFKDGLPRNKAYMELIRTLFRKSGERYEADRRVGRGAAGDFARYIGGCVGRGRRPQDCVAPPYRGAPTDERKFHFSYSGAEHQYIDSLAGPPPDRKECQSCHYNTAGTGTVTGPQVPEPLPLWRRNHCFLGLPGCE